MSTRRIFNEFDLEPRLMIATEAQRKAAQAIRDRRFGEAEKQMGVVVRWLSNATPATLHASPAYAAFVEAQREVSAEVKGLIEAMRKEP